MGRGALSFHAVILDGILNAEPNRKELILNRFGRGCRRDVFDNHPVWFGIIVSDQVKWNFVLFQEGLYYMLM
jgi:hypothetical protein